MNKSELTEKVAEKAELSAMKAKVAVDEVFRAMAGALERDERIEIRGFGSFVARHYQARRGRNPHTGETVVVVAKRRPFFKPGKELVERVNRRIQSPGRRAE